MSEDQKIVRIDAATFQDALGELAATIVQKASREGHNHIAGPSYIGWDIAVIVRYGASVYNLLNYLNADERRKGDCDWHIRYGVTAMSLVRALIDCLYNTSAILENPAEKGPAYRKSGFKKTLDDLDADMKLYANQPDRRAYLSERRRAVETLISNSGFTLPEITQMKKHEMWDTFGSYINRMQPGGTLTTNQQFLKTFAHQEWRQYSALSHAAYEAFVGTLGYVAVGAYYMSDFFSHDDRPKVEESYELFFSIHLGRSATVLLCLLTEIQAYCKFDRANINARICRVWDALRPLPETQELYDGRYRELMINRGILPPPV